jgi:hypothetical protein
MSLNEAPEPPCERCDDTGYITVRNTFPMAYVCPGSPPEYAAGVCEAKCDACRFPFMYRGEEEWPSV